MQHRLVYYYILHKLNKKINNITVMTAGTKVYNTIIKCYYYIVSMDIKSVFMFKDDAPSMLIIGMYIVVLAVISVQSLIALLVANLVR
jgi:hypothetical protein